MIKLRDYQEEAHHLTIQNFKKNKKVLLWVMAGGGKSITAGSFVAKYAKFYKWVLIVRKRDLVEQLAADALDTFGLDYSIFMAGHPKMDLEKSIQVCSKDTMDARDILPFEGEDNVVLIIDECDEFPDYQREIIERYSVSSRFFYFGMTATPFNGLDFFDVVINPITPKELLRRGILIPFDYKVPKQIDYTNMEVVNGAFKAEDIDRKLNNTKAIAGAFAAWLRWGDNRQTLIFSSNKDHSKNTESYINHYYNKTLAVHIDAGTSPAKRAEYRQQFIRGQIRFLLVVGLFKRGTNIKEIGCIWDQALTLSLNNHIQKLGRGSRKNDFYSDCIVLDVANNCLQLGGFYMDREVDLNKPFKRTKKDLDNLMMRVCEKCFSPGEVKDWGSSDICPYCGYRNAKIKKPKLSKYMENKLFMESASEEQIEQRKMVKDFRKILWVKQNVGKRISKDIAREEAQMKMLQKYGIDRVLKVRKSVGLTDKILTRFKKQQYVPLGGLDI